MKRCAQILVLLACLSGICRAETIVGGLVSGATGLDSEYCYWDAMTGGAPSAWADCTNEAVEIGSSGQYYLILTAAEETHDLVWVQIKSNEADTFTFAINNMYLSINLDSTTGTLGLDELGDDAILGEFTGNGDHATTITLIDENNLPIANARVTIKHATLDDVLAMLHTNINGEAIFALDDGTYRAICSNYGKHTFTVPETLTVSGDTSDTYVGTSFEGSAPTVDNVCVVKGYLYKMDGSADTSQTVSATLRRSDYPAGYDTDGDGDIDTTDTSKVVYTKTAISTTTNAQGYFELELTYSSRVLHLPDFAATQYAITIGQAGVAHDLTVPDATSATLNTLTWTLR